MGMGLPVTELFSWSELWYHVGAWLGAVKIAKFKGQVGFS
jgi:hypothetical protein